MIPENVNLFEMEPMKYFSFPSLYDSKKKQERIRFLPRQRKLYLQSKDGWKSWSYGFSR